MSNGFPLLPQGTFDFALPDNLDFEQTGFNMENPSRPQPSAPTYDPLPEAREGFTRTPKEEDVLVCPNCGDELSTGPTEVKRQVWVVKSCGHVHLSSIVSTDQS